MSKKQQIEEEDPCALLIKGLEKIIKESSCARATFLAQEALNNHKDKQHAD